MMNLYKISVAESFLDILADFIIDRFQDIEKIKVILPNGIACHYLQQALIKKKGILLLPKVVSFAELTPESAEAFKLPSEDIASISALEEKIRLAEIIHRNPKFGFNIIQSLKSSSQLAKLFYDLTFNNQSIEALQNLCVIEQAEHWQLIYNFLSEAYNSWQQTTATLKKSDKASYQAKTLEAEGNRLSQDDDNANITIAAGILAHNLLSWNFLKKLALSPRGIIILPPLGTITDYHINNYINSEEHPLYYLKILLQHLDKKLVDFAPLGSSSKQYYSLDNLLISAAPENETNAECGSIPSKISYYEFENIFEEAKAISTICEQHPNKKIAIIINNEEIKEIFSTFLNKGFLQFHSLLGEELIKLPAAELMLTLSEVLYNEFELQRLFILLKNPLLERPYIEELEKTILQVNRFISSYEQLLEIARLTGNGKLIEWVEDIVKILTNPCSNAIFSKMLTMAITAAEKICPHIWHSRNGIEVSNFLAELVNCEWQLEMTNPALFSELLKALITSRRFFENEPNSTNITLGKAQELMLLKFDLVILADCNEESYPPPNIANPWLHKAMQQKLGLCSDNIKAGLSLYSFYLLLHNKQVIITRAKKQNNNILLPSSYILKLQFILQKNLSSSPLLNEKFECNNATKNQYSLTQSSTEQFSFNFPTKLSATDIEMLVRCPYSFYAKKILVLRKQASLTDSTALADFGNFIHAVIDEYSKSYKHNKKLEHLLEIGSHILSKSIFPLSTQNSWRAKLIPIAKAFIEFDEQRRITATNTYSEIRGEMTININGLSIEIMAIADRIEVDDKGNAIILDYKTGSIPTKKDVKAGRSPQLIIEALIALASGFKIEVKNISQLIYIKIASREPYIKTVTIDITHSELEEHKKALYSLLEYYITHKIFPSDVDLLRYNPYKHLARLL